MSRRFLLFVLSSASIAVSNCGGGSSTPTTPTTPSQPSTPTRIISITGTLSFGNVDVGATSERTISISNNGNEPLNVTGMTGPTGYTASWTSGSIGAGGSQSITVRFAPTDGRSYSGTLTVNGNQTSGTNTVALSGTGVQVGPRTSFGSGTYLVGSDIQPGRYFSDPSSGCYFERKSGLGSSLSDIIANEFIGFNALQWIVDIRASDRAFSTDSECGTWFKDSPQQPAQGSIRPGLWLVGSQIGPGVYRSTVSSGCYWERKRAFDGTLDDIIDNDFVSSAGPQIVEIRSGDVGFQSDDQCGTWTVALGVAAPASVELSRGPVRSREDLERNWRLHRSRSPRPLLAR